MLRDDRRECRAIQEQMNALKAAKKEIKRLAYEAKLLQSGGGEGLRDDDNNNNADNGGCVLASVESAARFVKTITRTPNNTAASIAQLKLSLQVGTICVIA